jgi:prolyl-tRNA editing enzyme YbaK/EbsC (Cys-tRNA(Pro) deacylase)
MTANTERVKKYLERFGASDRVQEFEAGATATAPLAAQKLGCQVGQIAKSLSFSTPEGGALILVTAGDAKVKSGAFKRQFHFTPHMLKAEEVEPRTSHPIGGVCPFDLPEGLPVYLDVSLRRYETIYPACGSPSSMMTTDCTELERTSGARGWVDVCKDWREESQA